MCFSNFHIDGKFDPKKETFTGKAKVEVTGKGAYVIKARKINTKKTVVIVTATDANGLKSTKRIILKK